MKRVSKLNINTLKRIIAEEKAKIEKEKIYERLPRTSKNTRSVSKKAKVLKEVRDLVKLKKAQYKKLQELKAILKARKRIKKQLVERL